MSPQSLKPRKRPSNQVDWAVTVIVGAVVIIAAILFGSMLASFVYQ